MQRVIAAIVGAVCLTACSVAVPLPARRPLPPPPVATAAPLATVAPLPAPLSAPTPTLPAVPAQVSVRRLHPPVQYAVGKYPYALPIRKDPYPNAEIMVMLPCGAPPFEVDALVIDNISDAQWYHLSSGGWAYERAVSLHLTSEDAQAAVAEVDCPH